MNELTAISLKIPTPMLKKIKDQADEQERSMTGQVRFILGRHLKLTKEETECDDEESLAGLTQATDAAEAKTPKP